MNRTAIISVEDVYRNPQHAQIPLGYSGEFRLLKSGDKYISAYNGIIETANHYDETGGFGNVRIVLTPIKRKVVTFTETGEVRAPKKGEWYQGIFDGNFVQATQNYSDSRVIYTRTESEV